MMSCYLRVALNYTKHTVYRACGLQGLWSTGPVVYRACGLQGLWFTGPVVYRACGLQGLWSTGAVVYRGCGWLYSVSAAYRKGFECADLIKLKRVQLKQHVGGKVKSEKKGDALISRLAGGYCFSFSEEDPIMLVELNAIVEYELYLLLI